MAAHFGGESHTPEKDLANVGLLIYRADKQKLLVRYKKSQTPREYGIPHRTPRAGETEIETAKRIGIDSLGCTIPDDELDDRQSAIVENVKQKVKVCVFMVKATSQLKDLAELDEWRGWNYTFINLSSFQDRIWLHPDVGASASSIQQFLKG
ncbi:hypothetical protein FHL15_008535 [Xylaria flabelliformis]|uniref:Nudix hydrolase domain-containing protein n=1 Tax=Xylaria flabelliformis TaxID=2512241 RepID=A0A553HRI2_9PEZI|nr:hypothetical protein FHL15_008535 [Xylaria flabelliformis]